MKTFEELNKKLGGSEVESDWHRHSNGGGWVRKDAVVHQDAFIGENAIVYSAYSKPSRIGEFSRMHGGEMRGGEMWGGVMWGGEMWGGVMWGGVMWGGVMRGGEMRGGEMRGGEMRGGVMRGGVMWGGEMWGGEWKHAPLFIVGSRHTVCNAKPGYIQIGCKCETFKWWGSKEAKEFAKQAGYTAAEQKEYAAYIALVKKVGVKS